MYEYNGAEEPVQDFAINEFEYEYADQDAPDIDAEYHDNLTGNNADFTRGNTQKIMQITKSKTVHIRRHMKGLKSAYRKWKEQYQGLTWSEAMSQFLYNMSHSGITVATIIYCIVFIVIIGSTMWANYAQRNTAFLGRYALIGLNCVMGIVSLFFNFLPAILVFDYIIGCAGIGFTISCSWQINSGIETTNNSTLIVYAIIMVLIIPFRIFWWHKYRPNHHIALDIYSGLAQQGLIQKANVTAEENDEEGEEAVDQQEEMVIDAENEMAYTYGSDAYAYDGPERDDSMFTYQ